jgi:hypothetical protein
MKSDITRFNTPISDIAFIINHGNRSSGWCLGSSPVIPSFEMTISQTTGQIEHQDGSSGIEIGVNLVVDVS